MEFCAAKEIAGCYDTPRMCPADSSWPPATSDRSKTESDAQVRGRKYSSVHPDPPPRPLARGCSGEVFQFRGMALRAFFRTVAPGRQLLCVPMADWQVTSTDSVNAGRGDSFVRVAGRALNFYPLGGMWKVLDVRMAIGAAENAVDARHMRVGSTEIFLPLSDFIPAVPWQARQLSSCFSGCDDFGCA